MNNNKNRVLITGNAGMIGSVLTDFFIAHGFQVIGVDNLSRVLQHNIQPEVSFHHADITDQKKIDSIFLIENQIL